MHCRGKRSKRTDAAHVENVTGALSDHLLEDRFGNIEEPIDVGVDHLVPGSFGHGRKVVTAIYCSIIDQYVDPAKFLYHLADHLVDRRPISDRDLEGMSFAPTRVNTIEGRGSALIAYVIVECDVGTFARKDIAQGAPDSARTPGYDYFLSFE